MSNFRQASALLKGLFDDSASKYNFCQIWRVQKSSCERFISEDRCLSYKRRNMFIGRAKFSFSTSSRFPNSEEGLVSRRTWEKRRQTVLQTVTVECIRPDVTKDVTCMVSLVVWREIIVFVFPKFVNAIQPEKALQKSLPRSWAFIIKG